MKNHRLALKMCVMFLGASLLAGMAVAQERGADRLRPSPNASISQTVGTISIDITYGRPSVKGRDVFGGLVPWGQRWRAGANEPTAVTLSGDVVVEGQALAAGTYAMWVVPEQEGDWEVIFGTMVGWGTMAAQSEAVATVSVAPGQAAHLESMAFFFEELSNSETTLLLRWATTALPIRFALP